jgi:hypothetical protein
MARLTVSSAALVLAWTAATGPAAAQFNPFEAIFGPMRPPRDVPSRSGYPPSERLPPGPPPSQQYPQHYPQQYPQEYPPAARLPPGPPPGYQTQPLPPPPGAAGTPQRPAQPRPRDAAPALPPGTPPPPTETVLAPSALKITHPTAVFSGLDKVTGRIITFDVAINETVQFGALQVTPRACYTRPPSETPNTDSFMEVDEVTLQGEVRRIFTGWMFAASPGLHAVEHAIYDVWLVDCKGGATQVAESPPEPARPAQQRAAPRQPQQAQPQRSRPPAPAPTLPPPIR